MFLFLRYDELYCIIYYLYMVISKMNFDDAVGCNWILICFVEFFVQLGPFVLFYLHMISHSFSLCWSKFSFLLFPFRFFNFFLSQMYLYFYLLFIHVYAFFLLFLHF